MAAAAERVAAEKAPDRQDQPLTRSSEAQSLESILGTTRLEAAEGRKEGRDQATIDADKGDQSPGGERNRRRNPGHRVGSPRGREDSAANVLESSPRKSSASCWKVRPSTPGWGITTTSVPFFSSSRFLLNSSRRRRLMRFRTTDPPTLRLTASPMREYPREFSRRTR